MTCGSGENVNKKISIFILNKIWIDLILIKLNLI